MKIYGSVWIPKVVILEGINRMDIISKLPLWALKMLAMGVVVLGSSGQAMTDRNCHVVIVPKSSVSDEVFDDTLAPHKGSTTRRYMTGGDGEPEPYDLPLVQFVLELKISNFSQPHSGGSYELSPQIDLHQLLNPQFFEMLRRSTATARYYSMKVISLLSDGKFSFPELREALYRALWDDRMNPNLGITDDLHASLFAVAVENKDPVLMKFIVSRPGFDLIRNKPILRLLEAEQFQSAKIILKSHGSEIPSKDISEAIEQLAYGVEGFHPEAPNVFIDPLWIEAIHRIGPSSHEHKYVSSKGLPMPLIYAAVNLNFALALNMVNAGIPILLEEASIDPFYFSGLVVLRSRVQNSKRKTSSSDDQIRFEVLEKLLSAKANHPIKVVNRNVAARDLQVEINGAIYNVKDPEFKEIIGDISLSEVLYFFLGFKKNLLELRLSQIQKTE